MDYKYVELMQEVELLDDLIRDAIKKMKLVEGYLESIKLINSPESGTYFICTEALKVLRTIDRA